MDMAQSEADDALVRACREWANGGDDGSAVAEALANGASPDAAYSADGKSALIYAAMADDGAALGLLLDAGAQASKTDLHDGSSALGYAAAFGVKANVETLLAAGADPDGRWEGSRAEFTPLHDAIGAAGRSLPDSALGMATLLLAAGADPNARVEPPDWVRSGYDGCAALHLLAAKPGAEGVGAIAAELRAAGADLEAVDARGRTPLHIAAGLGSVEMVSSLVAMGANPRARDLEGAEPAWHARAGRAEGREAIASILESAKADSGTKERGRGLGA